jgi:hypothetical protein
MTHHGPVRDGKRYGALCGATPTVGNSISMTTHAPWITCPDCLMRIAFHQPLHSFNHDLLFQPAERPERVEADRP